MTELLPLKAKRRIWSLRRRGRCRRMSAEEGLRRELTIEEQIKTARFVTFYASSVSTSAATFPMGEGLDRLILNDTTITTALEWLRKSFNLFGHRTPRALPTAMLKPRLRGAARRAHGSSAEHAMRDLIASNAPLRNGSHKARQNGPKHYPGDSRGRSPLARLSPLSFVVQRKMGPPEVVPKRECP